jgi:hypothetical protein
MRPAAWSPLSRYVGSRGTARVDSRRHATAAPSLAPLVPSRDQRSCPLMRGVEPPHRPRLGRPPTFNLVQTHAWSLDLVVPDLDTSMSIRRIFTYENYIDGSTPNRPTVTMARRSPQARCRTTPGRPICRRWGERRDSWTADGTTGTRLRRPNSTAYAVLHWPSHLSTRQHPFRLPRTPLTIRQRGTEAPYDYVTSSEGARRQRPFNPRTHLFACIRACQHLRSDHPPSAPNQSFCHSIPCGSVRDEAGFRRGQRERCEGLAAMGQASVAGPQSPVAARRPRVEHGHTTEIRHVVRINSVGARPQGQPAA